jgi:hypothetical protein
VSLVVGAWAALKVMLMGSPPGWGLLFRLRPGNQKVGVASRKNDPDDIPE